MRRDRGTVLAAVALSALTTLAVGCGRISHRAAPGGNPAAGGTTRPAATAAMPAPAALTAVDSDAQAVDAATDQSDADFNAGVSAEAQNDQP